MKRHFFASAAIALTTASQPAWSQADIHSFDLTDSGVTVESATAVKHEAVFEASPVIQAPSDIWQRMRSGFAMPDLTTQTATDKTAWYAARAEYVKRSFERAKPFLFHIVQELEKRGMPTELALLPLVESAYNPKAVSPAHAAGMWQFIPSTGKKYKLTQDWWRDERRDIIASTNAALDYLQFLHGQFNDWHLALAAYNWGEGAVGRAIERASAKGEQTDYVGLRLHMPAETADYVPKLQAIKNIVMNPGRYEVVLPDVPNTQYFALVVIDRDIDVKTAAGWAAMPVEEFVALNPAHNRSVIRGQDRPAIVLPTDRVALFNDRLAAHQGPFSNWGVPPLKTQVSASPLATRFSGVDAEGFTFVANRVQPKVDVVRIRTKTGETTEMLARRLKVPVAVLRNWNPHLPKPKMAIKPGTTVVVALEKTKPHKRVQQRIGTERRTGQRA